MVHPFEDRDAEHLRSHPEIFGREQLLMRFTEDLGDDIDGVLRPSVGFVRADADGTIDTGERCNRNPVPAGEVAEQGLPDEERYRAWIETYAGDGFTELPLDQAARLADIYRDEVHELAETLDREPSWEAERWGL